METRKGLPYSLNILYLEVAKRLGIPCEPVFKTANADVRVYLGFLLRCDEISKYNDYFIVMLSH